MLNFFYPIWAEGSFNNYLNIILPFFNPHPHCLQTLPIKHNAGLTLLNFIATKLNGRQHTDTKWYLLQLCSLKIDNQKQRSSDCQHVVYEVIAGLLKKIPRYTMYFRCISILATFWKYVKRDYSILKTYILWLQVVTRVHSLISITCELHIVIWHRFVYFSCFPGCTFYAFQKQPLPHRQQVIVKRHLVNKNYLKMWNTTLCGKTYRV